MLLLVLVSLVGIVVISGQDMYLVSIVDMVVMVGCYIVFSVGGGFFVSVCESLWLFVQKVGLCLVVVVGDIDLCVLLDGIYLLVKLKIIQSVDEIVFSVYQCILFNGGGSYVWLDVQGIELGMWGQFQVWVSVKYFEGGNVMLVLQVEGVGMVVFDECFWLVDELKCLLKNVCYCVCSSSGKIWEGRSDV